MIRKLDLMIATGQLDAETLRTSSFDDFVEIIFRALKAVMDAENETSLSGPEKYQENSKSTE